ncbi:hypothetical protein HELRODRAFT_182047 [Helobdella robusta]|uniref:C-type lectin domain-containing protein n=1 Tax=Helobdella robusta TaxID=6412 RepID=T1FHN1_HELRO|nr:hypothetical protein HELRODRAFT_182047 [Helobdella robusta]ESN91869.1 hypothetical protein HELRODRAFT_182047 [Helobdella robusta]
MEQSLCAILLGVLDLNETNNSARLMQMNSGGKTFQDARKSCIQNNGDLLGRTIKESAVQETLVSKAGIGVTKIWIGLRQRETVYEWVDERDPAQTDTYFKSKSDKSLIYYGSRSVTFCCCRQRNVRHTSAYESLWNAVDANLKCVSYDVSSKKLGSLDCATPLPFACLYLPLPQGEITTESPSGLLSKDTASDSLEGKKTLLYIVLPLFLLGYGGACILYCVHKIIRHCCKKGAHAKLPTSSRPLSARKGVVYPIPVMTEPLPAKYPAAPVPPSYSINDAPASARQVQAELTDQDRKKALLLENAAREARERRQKELEQGRLGRIFSGQKKPQDPQMADEDRPESARSTSKLLPVPLASREASAPPVQQKQPQAAATPQQSPQQPQTSDPQNMAGMSINEILRNKMAQQANKKKPKKILAA